jgi:serine/threonine protein kinase
MSSVATTQSGLNPKAAIAQAEMTAEVGTRLYIAPEVLCPSGGRRDWTKVDMYSLGVSLFSANICLILHLHIDCLFRDESSVCYTARAHLRDRSTSEARDYIPLKLG